MNLINGIRMNQNSRHEMRNVRIDWYQWQLRLKKTLYYVNNVSPHVVAVYLTVVFSHGSSLLLPAVAFWASLFCSEKQNTQYTVWYGDSPASDVMLCSYGEGFSWCLCSSTSFYLLSSHSDFVPALLAGLSHQPADLPWVQPLRRRHGQLPVELQNVTA